MSSTLTRTRGMLLCGLLAALVTVAVASVAHAASSHRATSAATRTSVCTLKTFDLTPTAIRGEDFGVLNCARPFGRGVQHNTSVLSPTSATTGTLKGSSTLFFARGTVRARFALNYTISGSTIRFAGAAKVTGGTGTFKGVTGTGTLAGSSTDAGAHSLITERVKLKLP
jgi:hypothetical protein